MTLGWIGFLSSAWRRLTQLLQSVDRQEPRRLLQRRLELAWTARDRQSVEGVALAAIPREGAVVALCRKSTGASRDTFIVLEPIQPQPGDLSYHRGGVVTVTGRYWNRAIDQLRDSGGDTGLAVLHTHPGEGRPVWSRDDDIADTELAEFLFGEGFLTPGAPLVSLVASHSELRGRGLSFNASTGQVQTRNVERVRTISPERVEITSTADRAWSSPELGVPDHADRSVRVFGKDGQRLLADVHIVLVGAGGVGSICGEHLARWGIGRLSFWDPDIVKGVNINRSAVFTFRDAYRETSKVRSLAKALSSFSLVRTLVVRWRDRDIRGREELSALLDADVIVTLVDDIRPRHFINRLAFAHYIPVLDGGNAIRSTAEDNPTADTATVEGGGVRISHLTPGGPCLWCSGHIDPVKLSLAYRSEGDRAADRARGYVENLGPEHAPSVMPVNSMTAAMLEIRLQDLLFGLSRRAVPEVYFDLIGGTLDELPRKRNPACRQCARWEGWGDAVELPFAD